MDNRSTIIHETKPLQETPTRETEKANFSTVRTFHRQIHGYRFLLQDAARVRHGESHDTFFVAYNVPCTIGEEASKLRIGSRGKITRWQAARATPKRVIVADIYTFVALPAWLRDSAQDLSVDPPVSRPAIK